MSAANPYDENCKRLRERMFEANAQRANEVPSRFGAMLTLSAMVFLVLFWLLVVAIGWNVIAK